MRVRSFTTIRLHCGTVMHALPFLYHYALDELVSNLKCSIGGSQATGSNVVFCGLGVAVFLKLKSNIISDPPPGIFSTCSGCL